MQPEPWLRGPVEGVDPLLAPVWCCLQQVREDLARFTEGLETGQIWARPFGLAPVGFQLRHIAGSMDRLLTYARGAQLDEVQLAAMRSGEMEPGATREELLAAVDASLDKVEAFLRSLDPARLSEPRSVGRKQLPTTLQGLLVHIAEHSQRHTGQAIVAVRLLQKLSGGSSRA
jgi:DinB family protein